MTLRPITLTALPLGGLALAGAVLAEEPAVVGPIIGPLPPACSTVQVGTVTCQECGSSWYQPGSAGTSVQSVLVNPPS